jgi:rod shape-determining protein MreB
VSPSRLLRPRVVVCVPSDITSVERRALEDAMLRAGARRVYVIEEPMAAAIGAGLPVHETAASMVVDIGGGTTDVAVISLGGVVSARSVRIGGDEVDDAIVAHLKSEYSLLLGERSAEQIKVAAGSAFPLREEISERVRGRDLVTGLPKTVVVNSTEIRRAIEGPLLQIVELVRSVLDVCPPELAGDVLDRGVVLTGGGALLRGLDERLRHELGVPVHVADDPLRAVARGAGRCVEEFSTLQRVLVDNQRP